MSDNMLTVLEIDGHRVRHREAPDGTLVFHHEDVCRVLGFGNPRQALRTHVDSVDVRILDAQNARGQKRMTNWITEAAVNCLIFGSNLPEARKYTRAVAAFIAQVRRGEIEVRATKDLEVKVKAFIAEKTREWELMFQRRFYEELDRLSGFQRTHPNKHPSVYGVVTDKIYRLLDVDIAEHLRAIIPAPTSGGPKRHQALTDLGRQRLREVLISEVSRMEMCSSLSEYLWYLDEKISRQQRLPLRLVNTQREEAREAKRASPKRRANKTKALEAFQKIGASEDLAAMPRAELAQLLVDMGCPQDMIR